MDFCFAYVFLVWKPRAALSVAYLLEYSETLCYELLFRVISGQLILRDGSLEILLERQALRSLRWL